MADGRAIIESSAFDGVIEAIEIIQHQFGYVSATIPVKTKDGRYISSLHYSNETTIMEVPSNVARN